jgi:hypothetical protein
MIERLFDHAQMTPAGRSSVLKERLRGWSMGYGPLRVELLTPRSVVVFEGEAHVAGPRPTLRPRPQHPLAGRGDQLRQPG